MEKMEKPSDLEQWLKKMGYTGNVPKNMDGICNTSTEHLWAYLMKNLRPKQEVVDIRRRLIAHQIKTKSYKSHGSLCGLQEVTVYNKNRKLETRLKEIQHDIEEKKRELNSLSQKVKIKSLLIKQQEDNITEIKDKTNLLNKKKKLLEKDAEEAQRYIDYVKNFIPTVIEEVPNIQVVSETLQESANKLEKQFRQSLVNFSNSSLNFSTAPTPSLRHPRRCLSSTMTPRTRLLFPRESTINPDHSLQLLPDSCLDNSNLFLLGSSSELVPICHQSTPYVSSVRISSILPPLSTTNKTTVRPNMSKLLLEKLYMESSVQDKLKNLLWEQDWQVIWNVFLGLEENLRNELLKISLQKRFPRKTMSEEDFMQLEMFHIETALEVRNNRALTEYYNQEVIKIKDRIKESLINEQPDKIEQIMNTLDLKLKKVALDVGFQVMEESIFPKANFEPPLQLLIVSKTITKLEENIAKKSTCISNYLDAIQGILCSTKDIQDDAMNRLDTLILFNDKSEDSLYIQNAFTEELAMFEKFPLNYNRACTFTNPNVYFRDIYPNIIPTDINLDTNTLHILADILETPFDPPEVVMLNFIKAKKKLETLNKIETITVPASEKYSLNDLRCRESFVDLALDRLMKLKRSKTCLEVSTAGDTLKKVRNMQIPFKDVVAPSRKVDGKGYKFYEEEFDTYFRSLNEDQ